MRALLDLLLPPRCPGCGREDTVFCEACRLHLERRRLEPAGAPIGLPADIPAGLVQLEWCATFSGSVRAAIHAFKYGADRRLAAPLADELAVRWSHAGVGGDLITWVPSHRSRRRERGFDQAEDLAVAMGKRLGLPSLGCLERDRETDALHALDRTQRARNTRDVFSVRAPALPHLSGRWVVLVDDIVTTGATLGACAMTLGAGGAAAVSAITVARDR